MALQTGGAISIGDIKTELGVTTNSLDTLSNSAGFGRPHSMSEFYGFSNAPEVIDVRFIYGYNSPYAVYAYTNDSFPPFNPPVEVTSNWSTYYYSARGRFYYTINYTNTYTFSTPQEIFNNSYYGAYRGDSIITVYNTRTTSADPRINIV